MDISDEIRKTIESAASLERLIQPPDMSEALRHAMVNMDMGISGEIKKIRETMLDFDRLTQPPDMSEALRQAMANMDVGISGEIKKIRERMLDFEGLNQLPDVSEALRQATVNVDMGISGEIKKIRESILDFQRLAQPPGLSDALTETLSRTELLSRNVDHYLSNIQVPGVFNDQFRDNIGPLPLEWESSANWRTNNDLSQLTGMVTRLVEVAQNQAELLRAIRISTDIALRHSMQSGEDTQIDILLNRKGVRLAWAAIWISVAGIVVSFLLSKSADTRSKEEVQLLKEISQQLRILNNKCSGQPATTSATRTGPNTHQKAQPDK